MLQFITGEKGSGKTTFAHRLLAQKVHREGAKAVLLVPRQFTFESDKGILDAMGPKDACEAEDRKKYSAAVTAGTRPAPGLCPGCRRLRANAGLRAAQRGARRRKAAAVLSCTHEGRRRESQPERA